MALRALILNHLGVVKWGYSKLHGPVCCAVWVCHGSASVSLMQSRDNCINHWEEAQQPVWLERAKPFSLHPKQSPSGLFGAGTLSRVIVLMAFQLPTTTARVLLAPFSLSQNLFPLLIVTRKEKEERTEVFSLTPWEPTSLLLLNRPTWPTDMTVCTQVPAHRQLQQSCASHMVPYIAGSGLTAQA